MFHTACLQFGIPHAYVEEDGSHNWAFWDRHVKRFLKAVLGEPAGPIVGHRHPPFF